MSGLPRIDRRTTLRWLAATMAAGSAGCGTSGRYVGDEIPPPPPTLLGNAAPASGMSIGTDPDLLDPVVPWPRTMTGAQLDTAAATCDLILPADDLSPAASALGVHEFIDEWVSAPYAQQQADRSVIFYGLEWLEQASRANYSASFAALASDRASSLLDRIVRGTSSGGDDARLTEFYERIRYLAVGAYYTTDIGMADLGYIGDTPIGGPYPGPDEAALQHLAGVLAQLGLEMPS